MRNKITVARNSEIPIIKKATNLFLSRTGSSCGPSSYAIILSASWEVKTNPIIAECMLLILRTVDTSSWYLSCGRQIKLPAKNNIIKTRPFTLI